MIGAVAQQAPDFSGTYILKSSGMSDSRSSAHVPNVMWERVIKRVVQDSTSVTITLQGRAGEVTREYKLDGTKIRGEEPDGTPTVEWAEIKGKKLIIRSSIKTKGALQDVLKTQKWELSKDLKTLTVYEQLQAEGMHIVNDSLTISYTRH